MDVQKLIEEVKGMTVLELNELVKALEAEFGVSAAAPVAAAGAGAAGAEAAPAAEEKTEFDVVLKDIGPNKIAIINLSINHRVSGCTQSIEIAFAKKGNGQRQVFFNLCFSFIRCAARNRTDNRGWSELRVHHFNLRSR